MARAEAYLHAKFHLDPFNRLATIHQRYRQTGQTDSQTDRQRSDGIWVNRFTNAQKALQLKIIRRPLTMNSAAIVAICLLSCISSISNHFVREIDLIFKFSFCFIFFYLTPNLTCSYIHIFWMHTRWICVLCIYSEIRKSLTLPNIYVSLTNIGTK